LRLGKRKTKGQQKLLHRGYLDDLDCRQEKQVDPLSTGQRKVSINSPQRGGYLVLKELEVKGTGLRERRELSRRNNDRRR